jgi:uncharacterized membrane protein YphA (DoxX/SURF4 family)
MKFLRNFFRILVGLVFVFSGFVKGVDPLGTVYRIEDYFNAFGMTWAIPFATFLSISLCTLEFIIGISLLFNLWIKGTAWALLPMMTYFTILTFFDAVYNIVPDCGCFGDAIKLTNLQTFLKNLVLMAMVIPIFVQRNKFRGLPGVKIELILLLIFIAAFSGMSVHSYRHLPLIDFMGWKVGNVINKNNAKPVQFYVTFRNKKTGEEKEYLAPNYPWNDSTWMAEWSFKSQRAVDPNGEKSPALRAEDELGNDVTAPIIDNPDFQFILVANNLSTTNRKGFLKILPFYKKAVSDGYSFVCLTNAMPGEIKRFRLENGTAFGFYTADDVVLKTMVRSNPGLILLKNGKVLGKWDYHDFPSYEQLMKKFRNAE